MTVKVFIPRDTTTQALGGEQVVATLQAEAAQRELDIEIVRNGSRGICWLEPLIEVETANGRAAYGPVSPSDIPALLESGMLDGSGSHPLAQGEVEEIPYLKKQQRLTFARAGVTDAVSVEDYRAHGGFVGLEKALQQSAQAIVDEVKASGLRGRGGVEGNGEAGVVEALIEQPHQPVAGIDHAAHGTVHGVEVGGEHLVGLVDEAGGLLDLVGACVDQADAILNIGDDGRRVEIAVTFKRRATTAYSGPLSTGIINQFGYLAELIGILDRTEGDAFFQPVAHVLGLSQLNQTVGEGIMNAVMNIQALQCGASLTHVQECCLKDTFRNCIHIGIGQYDGGVVTAQFQRQSFQVIGCTTHDVLAGLG